MGFPKALNTWRFRSEDPGRMEFWKERLNLQSERLPAPAPWAYII